MLEQLKYFEAKQDKLKALLEWTAPKYVESIASQMLDPIKKYLQKSS